MSKHCPILILTSVIGKTFGNVGSCYVVMGDKCIKESCALWNESQGRSRGQTLHTWQTEV